MKEKFTLLDQRLFDEREIDGLDDGEYEFGVNDSIHNIPKSEFGNISSAPFMDRPETGEHETIDGDDKIDSALKIMDDLSESDLTILFIRAIANNPKFKSILRDFTLTQLESLDFDSIKDIFDDLENESFHQFFLVLASLIKDRYMVVRSSDEFEENIDAIVEFFRDIEHPLERSSATVRLIASNVLYLCGQAMKDESDR